MRSIGETIGVQLIGSHNMFGVLARKGKGKKTGVVEGDGNSLGAVEGA